MNYVKKERICWIKSKTVKQKQKTQKKSVIKRKLKYEDYKSCLKATQHENKINHIENLKLT